MGKYTRKLVVGIGGVKETDVRFAAERKLVVLHLPLKGNCCY
jgi:hypothetical protein